MQFIKPDINIDFFGKRYMAFSISGLLFLGSILFIIFKGPVMGVDFSGGTVIQIKFDSSVKLDDVKAGLKLEKIGKASVQEYGSEMNNEYLIRTQQTSDSFENLTAELKTAMESSTGKKADIRSIEMVGPQVGSDLRKKALLAIFYSMVLIILYISARFETGWIRENKWVKTVVMTIALLGGVYALSMAEFSIPILITAALLIALVMCWFFDLKYALGAIIALIHDVTITTGIFVFLEKEFSLSIIAALLTIIGYSLNDTIIIFDRIRENIAKSFSRNLVTTINRSINETLSRTILTSGLTLLSVICLFVLGGNIVHDFAFAMIVGIVIGTYSSIYIASPILLFWEKNPKK